MASATTVRSGKVDAAAAALGMRPPTVLDLAEPFAFTVGFFSPRIVLSRGLVRRLTLRELTAVLAHERAHQRGRDPLRGVVESTLGAIFFWVPSLADLVAHARLRREIAADRDALAATDRRTLASALMRSATSAASSVPMSAVAFGRFSDRVGALAAGSTTVPLTLRTSRLVVTAFFLLCLTVVGGLRPAAASTQAELCVSGAYATDAVALTPFVRIISPMGEMTDVAP
jgi:beta-lactamase regulating signal transducer with metallopeptidase domain